MKKGDDSGYVGLATEYFTQLKCKTGMTCATERTVNWNVRDVKSFERQLEKQLEPCTQTDQQDSCPCDVIVGPFLELPELANHVHFLPDIGYDSLHVFAKQDVVSNDSSSIVFRAFEPDVWVAIVGLAIFFIVLKMMDRRFSPQQEIQEPDQQTDTYNTQTSNTFELDAECSEDTMQAPIYFNATEEEDSSTEEEDSSHLKRIREKFLRAKKSFLRNRLFYRIRKGIQNTGMYAFLSVCLINFLRKVFTGSAIRVSDGALLT